MTQKTKLEIIGHYTPEHPGPFCTREGNPVDLRIRDGRGENRLIGYIGDNMNTSTWGRDGGYLNCTGIASDKDLMNAREVPVAREFWVNEFKRADGYIGVSHAHETERKAINERHELENWNWTRTIHVREVLPGEE